MVVKKEEPKEKIHFTKRQLMIMQLWSELPSEAAIADHLKISKHTVHTHLRRMRKKLGVQRTFDVWKYLNGGRLIRQEGF